MSITGCSHGWQQSATQPLPDQGPPSRGEGSPPRSGVPGMPVRFSKPPTPSVQVKRSEAKCSGSVLLFLQSPVTPHVSSAGGNTSGVSAGPRQAHRPHAALCLGLRSRVGGVFGTEALGQSPGACHEDVASSALRAVAGHARQSFRPEESWQRASSQRAAPGGGRHAFYCGTFPVGGTSFRPNQSSARKQSCRTHSPALGARVANSIYFKLGAQF